jgi:hypothetical protein
MVWVVVLDSTGGVDGVVPAGDAPGTGMAGDVSADGFEGEDGAGAACSGAVGAVPTLGVDGGAWPADGAGPWLGGDGDGGVWTGGIACVWLGGDADAWAGGIA